MVSIVEALLGRHLEGKEANSTSCLWKVYEPLARPVVALARPLALTIGPAFVPVLVQGCERRCCVCERQAGGA